MRTIITRGPLAGLALLLALSACEKRRDTAELPAGSDSSRQGQALVRVINAAPDAKAVDLAADEANAFTAVTFKTVTPYQAVNDNFVSFKLRETDATATDSTAPEVENREMLDDGSRYTVVVIPGEKIEDHPKLMVLDEPNDSTATGKARVRVVNAARGLGEFDLFVRGQKDPLLGDVEFNSEAGFKDLDAQSAALQFRVKNSPRILLDLPSRAWESGHSYTIVLTNKGATERGLEAIVVEDQAGM